MRALDNSKFQGKWIKSLKEHAKSVLYSDK